MFEVIKQEGKARRGVFTCAHGTVQTPVFMNVGTQGAIKGGISAADLEQIGCQIELSNTYHLHVRPGDDLIQRRGGLHSFITWNKPILTDSGGFQIFSLAGLRKITEQGVTFHSHVDGRVIFMGPEESMQIQSHLGSDIAMAFDECIKIPSPYAYVKDSCDRTYRWLVRCKTEMDRLNTLPDTINPHQMLFGINQGAVFHDLRIAHMKKIAELDLDGYAIGGLAVGEPQEVMLAMIEEVAPILPQDRPRYLMGVGTPDDMLEAVARGIDMFDCVMPTRNGRHGHVFTRHGVINLRNARHADDPRPLDEESGWRSTSGYSRAYLHHLVKSEEALGAMLLSEINVAYYHTLMSGARAASAAGTFDDYRASVRAGWARGDIAPR